jgi:hypothetical protein
MKIASLIYNWLFLLVIGVDIFCCIVTYSLFLRKKDKTLLIFSVFFIASAFTSSTSFFIDSYLIRKTIILLFYVFDFIFFMMLTYQMSNNINLKQAIKVISLVSPLILLFILIFVPFERRLLSFEFLSNIFILCISIAFFYNIYHKSSIKKSVPEDLFFFISAFFIYNVSTIAGNFLVLADCYTSNGIIETVSRAILFIVWMIKCLLLLKSVKYKFQKNLV